MDFQGIIVFTLIALAAAYGVVTLALRRRAFSPKKRCDDDCGCGG